MIDNKQRQEFWEPVFGTLEVSSLCNYKCIMCPFPQNKKEEFKFSVEDLLKILKDITNYTSKKLDLTIFGGEPLLWKKLEEFISKIDKNKINPLLNTNASLLTLDRIKKLKEAGLRDYIISLESINPEVNDYYRGKKGSFKEVMKAIDIIDKIYKRKQVITVLPVIMEKNYRGLHKMIKWVADNPKINYVSMQALMPNIKIKNRIDKSSAYKDIWPKNPSDVEIQLRRIMALKRIGYIDVISNPNSQLETFMNYYKTPKGVYFGERIHFCTYFTIKANGDLIISGQNMGSLNNTKFSHLWESKKSIKARENVINNKVSAYWIINTQHAYPRDNSNIFNQSRKTGKLQNSRKPDKTDLLELIDNKKFYENNFSLYLKNGFNHEYLSLNPFSRKTRIKHIAQNSLNKNIQNLRPKLVMIKLLNICSFKCKMCNVWEDKDNTILDLELGYKIIDQILRFKDENFNVHFIGGETLLYENLPELINYSSSKGINTMITTNGYNLNKEKINMLSEAGLTHMNISLDSIDEKTHDFIRGKKGSYDRIMNGIGLLKKHAPNMNVSINTVISEMNLFDLVLLSRYVQNETYLTHIYFIAMDKPFQSNYDNNWRYTSPINFMWPKNRDKINQAFDLLIKEKRDNEKINNSIAQLEVYRSYYLYPEKFVKKKGCKFGDKNIQIDQAGDIMLCSKNFLPMGNINKDKINRLFFSKKADVLRAEMSNCTDNCVQILSCSYENE